MYPKERTWTAHESRTALCVFSAFCYIYGVGIGRQSRKLTTELNFSTKLRRSLVFTALSGFVAGEFYEACTTTPLKPSLLNIAKLVKFCCDAAILVIGGVTLMTHDRELSRIIRSNEIVPSNICWRSLCTQLILSATSFGIDVSMAVRSVLGAKHVMLQIGNVCGVYVWPIQYLTFCIYAQLGSAVRSKLICLTDMIKSPASNYEVAIRVAASKIFLRNVIKDINTIFSSTLITIHVKVFFLCVYSFGLMILWKTDDVYNHVLDVAGFASSLMQIMQIYAISRLGTNVIRRFQSIEAFLLRPSMLDFGRLGVSRRDIREVRSVLEYREDFDSLRIVDDVVNCKANMFTFIASMFTGTAIFLQFDYDVLSAIERSKKFPSIWKE